MKDKEVKITKKQKIVAGIIVLVAIMLLASVFGGKKEETQKPTAPIKVEEKLPIKEDMKAKEEAPKAEIEEAAITEEPKAETEEPQPSVTAEETTPQEEVVEEVVVGESKPEITKEVIEIEPQNSVLTFETTTDKALNYQIFYTVEREVWYDASHVVEYQGEAGAHKYSIVIPSDKVYRVRIDFDSNPGKVTIKNIYLDGAQKADLNNFEEYAYNQINAKEKNEDGSLTLTSDQDDPYMEYATPLLPE